MNQEFLEVLFPDLKDGFIEVRLIHSTNKTIQTHFYSSIEELVAHQSIFDDCSKKFNIYFGICPRSKKEGNKESVKSVWCLWVDIDAKDFTGGKQEILDRLNSFPFPPTIVVESGNGFHVYWRLKEPFLISDSRDIGRIEGYLRSLAQALGADSSAAELARILRLPGTLNHKNSQTPKPVAILKFNPRQQCNLSDFESILTITPTPDVQKTNPLGWIKEAFSNIQEGNRNATFAKIIGRLHHDDWQPKDILSLLEPHAMRSSFPLDELSQEINGICHRYSVNKSFPSSNYNSKEIETENKPLVAVRLSVLLTGETAKVEWIVEKIIPKESSAILASPAGYGKTWMLLAMAIECGYGGKWLGKFPVSKSTVLYIDEESSVGLLQVRLNKLLKAKNIPIENLDVHFIIGQGFCLSKQSSVDQLRDLIKKHNPNLIIIDSLIRVHTAEENSSTEMSKVTAVIKNLIREFKCTFLFADHQRKPNHFSIGQDQLLRGSSEKAAFVDTLLSVKRKDDLLIVEHSKSRFAEAIPSFIIEIKDPTPETTQVIYVGEAEAKLQIERLKTVNDFLKSALDHGDWVSRKDLVERAKLISISEKMLDETLKNHFEIGLIEREERKLEGRGGKAYLFRWRVNASSSLFPIQETEIDSECPRT